VILDVFYSFIGVFSTSSFLIFDERLLSIIFFQGNINRSLLIDRLLQILRILKSKNTTEALDQSKAFSSTCSSFSILGNEQDKNTPTQSTHTFFAFWLSWLLPYHEPTLGINQTYVGKATLNSMLWSGVHLSGRTNKKLMQLVTADLGAQLGTQVRFYLSQWFSDVWLLLELFKQKKRCSCFRKNSFELFSVVKKIHTKLEYIFFLSQFRVVWIEEHDSFPTAEACCECCQVVRSSHTLFSASISLIC